MEQISYAEPLAKNGETCLSPQAWVFARDCVIEGPQIEERPEFHLLLRMDESRLVVSLYQIRHINKLTGSTRTHKCVQVLKHARGSHRDMRTDTRRDMRTHTSTDTCGHTLTGADEQTETKTHKTQRQIPTHTLNAHHRRHLPISRCQFHVTASFYTRSLQETSYRFPPRLPSRRIVEGICMPHGLQLLATNPPNHLQYDIKARRRQHGGSSRNGHRNPTARQEIKNLGQLITFKNAVQIECEHRNKCAWATFTITGRS